MAVKVNASATASVVPTGAEADSRLSTLYGANSESNTLVNMPAQRDAAVDPARVLPAAINYSSWVTSYAQLRSEPKAQRPKTNRRMRKRAKNS